MKPCPDCGQLLAPHTSHCGTCRLSARIDMGFVDRASDPTPQEETMRDLEARSAKTADVRRDAWPIRHALHRLLAQDSWERPYVDAARESLDALIAKYVELAEAVPIVTDGRFDAASAVELAADWRDEEAQA